MPVARISIAVVYIWFGVLKMGSASAAVPLVQALYDQTVPFFSVRDTLYAVSIYEIMVGIVMLTPRFERLSILLLIVYMGIVILPLFLLPAYTWQGWFVPTLEGQYIIKNLAIIALAISIAAHLHPLGKDKREKM